MRVMVTGGSGFIGQSVVRHLTEQGIAVTSVSRSRERGRRESSTLADLHDRSAVREIMTEVRPTHLVHLAWMVDPKTFWTSPENERWVTSSLGLFEEFERIGGQRLVVAGTCAEYDWSAKSPFVEGATRIRPGTDYGRAKAELYRTLAGRDLSVAWARIFHPYGPGEHASRFVPSITRAMLHDRPVRCRSGHLARDFVYVDDVAEAFRVLLFDDEVGPFNVGSGTAVQLSAIVDRIQRELRWTGTVSFDPPPDTEVEPMVLEADVSRISGLGWVPSTSLEIGINRSIEWWTRQRDGKLR